MKQKIFKLLSFLLCMALLSTMSSCEEDLDGALTFHGTVNVIPSEVKSGSDVTVTLSNNIGDISYDNQLDLKSGNKYAIKSVTYFIDGKKVAESNKRDNSFQAIINTSRLTPGTYTVTARCESGFKDFIITDDIVAGNLTILQDYTKTDHCDLICGYMFSEDVLKFLEPLITVYVDGLDPIEIPVTKEDMISAENSLKFTSTTVSMSPKSNYYCWKGIQIPQKNIQGHITVTYKEKFEDYSEFEPYKDDYIFSSKPFVYAYAVNRGSEGSINLNMLSVIDITIGEKMSIEKAIQSIINSKDNTIEFNTNK